MKNKIFSPWMKWDNRNKATSIKMPGIYAIAVSDQNLEEKDFKYMKEIVYFGMTNSKGGLRSRLKAFDNTIKNKTGHGGAARFRFKHIQNKIDNNKALGRNKLEQVLIDKLYVSILPFECDVTTHSPKDLRVMGDVVKTEYDCFAKYVECFESLPEFNDMKRSPKK